MPRILPTRLIRELLLASLCLIPLHALAAQQSDPSLQNPEASADTSAPASDDPLVTMIPHAEWDRLWLSGQANFISQWHPAFHSPYQRSEEHTSELQSQSNL